MSKAGVWAVVAAFFFGIVGSILTFVPPQNLVQIGLGFGRHNDRVLIGVLALIIAVVCVYKLLTLVWEYKVPRKHSKKKK
ncbi:MAG TPA: hypothetical protein VLJ21_01070 [Candidatus Binatia bacterium]|nr:hypothetical protein [Candidatus Binatia bacterium]